MSKKPDVDSLRAQLQRLTGRVPLSYDPKYLARRIAVLEERRKGGEDVHSAGEPQTVFSTSMPVAARDAVDRILESEGIAKSKLVRLALELWARSNGYPKEAVAIGGDG